MFIHLLKSNIRANNSNEIYEVAALYKWKDTLNLIARFTHVDCNSNKTIFILQSWGDHTDILQAVVIYIFAAGAVYLYCWLGNELSEQVRIYSQSRTEFKISRYFYERNTLRVSST